MTFAGVGVMGTAAHYLTLIILVELVNLTPVIASSCGAIVGALINYMLNYRFTFNSDIAHTKALTKFMIVALAGFVINLAIMWLFTSVMVFNYMIAQIIATSAVLTGGYTGNRIWTFKSS
jgi:putative flippase GtrA